MPSEAQNSEYPDKGTALTMMKLAGFRYEVDRDSFGGLKHYSLVTPDGYSYVLPRLPGEQPYITAWRHFLQLTHND